MKRILLAALATAILPLAAQAGDLSYSYLQGGYDYTNSDSGHNSHGWGGTGSVALGQNFQVFGGGSRVSHDHLDAISNVWNLGGGFHTAISDRTDFVADVDYRQATLEGRSGDARAYSGELGVRSALAPHFEGWAMAGYANSHNDNLGHNNSEKLFGKLGGQYKFDKNWGLVGVATVSHNGESYFVGPRFSF